jgi:PAS domain-containing protein
LVNAVYVFSPPTSGWLDWFPLLFAFSGLLCAVVLLRYRFLDIVPVAHDMVIKNLSDGLVTLDCSQRIIEINPAAEHILGLRSSRAVGQAGGDVLGEWFDRAVLHPLKQSSPEEVTLGKGVDQRQYDVMVSPLIDRRGENTGSACWLKLCAIPLPR